MSTIADQIKAAQASLATWPEWLIPEYVPANGGPPERCPICGHGHNIGNPCPPVGYSPSRSTEPNQ